MSTDQAPALDHATEAVRQAWGDANIDGYGDEGAGYDESILARAAVSAALHDPGDRVLAALREEFGYQMRTSAAHGRAGRKIADEDIDKAARYALDKARAAILGSG